MSGLEPIVLAALVGCFSGFLISMPVGPVNLTILNEGAQRGFLHAALISLGAVSMEVIYCLIAFTGFASLFEAGIIKAAMELVSFVFLVFLGFKFLVARTVEAPTHLTRVTDRIEARIEERLDPHSAFMTGFVQVMANPGVLLFWIILAANLISRGWVGPAAAERLACVAGVTLGVGGWFLGLSAAASLGRARFSEHALLQLERASGVALLILAAWHGIHLILSLARGAL
ncbi:MAG: LysE family translocator [Verrucomicrobia bacterium]|jgi:threonine/homoserine/homoserine lactone efflux protein|nr:LysE family translocator [Verrucomicrobiota bacterium]